MEGNGRPVVVSVGQKIGLKSVIFGFAMFSWNKKHSDADGGSGMNERCVQQDRRHSRRHRNRCELWAVGCELWAAGCELWAVGCEMWVVGCGL